MISNFKFHNYHRTADTTLTQITFPINGIDSNGNFEVNQILSQTNTTINNFDFKHHLAHKQFELTNHLGNVLATILDRKTNNTADVVTAQHYYPFGSVMSSYRVEEIGYRFGFNGKEDDNETQTQDYGIRIYNKLLGKFLSPDPLSESYPFYSPYQFASNTPIMAIDVDGLESQTAINGQVFDGPRNIQDINKKIVEERTNQNIRTLTGRVKLPDLSAKSTPINKIEAPKQKTEFSSIEFKITIGAQVGLEIKRALGIEANMGSVDLFSATSTTTNTRFGKATNATFDFAGKNNQYNFTAGGGITTPLLAGSYDFNQIRGANGGTNSPIVKHSLSGMIGMPEIGLGVSGTSAVSTNNKTGESDYSSFSGGEYGFKASFVIGIEFKVKVGATSESN